MATPNIDALRRDGILYRRAYAHCPLTLPSHASMLTGLLPTEHGVRNNIGFRLDGKKFQTLARLFGENGYRTGAAVSSYVLRSETGIGDGFHFYDDSVPVTGLGATSEYQRSGFETVKQAQAWLSQTSSEPFFLFLHIYEPHAPYAAPEPFKSRYADPYDGEIAAADAIVGQLIETLKSAGAYDRAIVVFTSDHGEALWEHGEDQHGILLYREVLQVPLLIKLPRSARAGSVVMEPFELRRLFGAILQWTGIPSRAREQPSAIYSETLYPRIHLGWSELRSLIDGRYHYIESSSPELYDLERDPGETTNVIGSERRVAAAMRRVLESFPAPEASLGRIDPEEAAKLAALGYVGTPRQRTGPLPNPREQIHLLPAIKEAFRLANERRNDEAIRALRSLLDANRRLTDVASRLAEVLMDSERYAEAIDVYRSAMSQAERFSPDLALALAVAYLRAGEVGQAASHAELALSANPLEAHEILARIQIEQRRFRDAERHVRLAIDAGDRQPRSLLLLAELQRAEGNLRAALQSIALAEQRMREMGMSKLFNIEHLRGDVLARLDRPEEAIAAYQREIAHFPQHLQSYANLAIIHLIEGRRNDADQVLQQMVEANPHQGARALAARTRKAFQSAAAEPPHSEKSRTSLLARSDRSAEAGKHQRRLVSRSSIPSASVYPPRELLPPED